MGCLPGCFFLALYWNVAGKIWPYASAYKICFTLLGEYPEYKNPAFPLYRKKPV